MIDQNTYNKFQAIALKKLQDANIAVTEEEKGRIEVADFGLNRMEEIGLLVLTYVNTQRCCAKELILTPYQICPEHRHPQRNGEPGKEETFRCRSGEVYLYVEGEWTNEDMKSARIPADKKDAFTVFHKIVLQPGEQYTLQPDTLHWFQAGKDGCIVSEFSTNSDDDSDLFTDKQIIRAPQVED